MDGYTKLERLMNEWKTYRRVGPPDDELDKSEERESEREREREIESDRERKRASSLKLVVEQDGKLWFISISHF